MNEGNRLATKLKELRKAHSYTQDYVAETLGIVRQTYSHYETGKRTPSSEMLYKLAGLYEISIDDLMYLVISLDRNTYFDAPAPSEESVEIEKYLEFTNSPSNVNKLKHLNNLEKELLFYFERISLEDKKEIIEFTKIKARKKWWPMWYTTANV